MVYPQSRSARTLRDKSVRRVISGNRADGGRPRALAVGAGVSSEAGVYAGQKAGVRGDALQQRDESSPAGFIECGEKFGVVFVGSALGLGE